MINKPSLYCPGVDKKFTEWCYYFLKYFPACYQDPFFGGSQSLGELSPDVKLYLFIHGHETMPVFQNETGMTWTAAEMAAQMAKDGFRKDHRDLEMLVCSAGLSLNTNKIVAEMEQLGVEYKAALAIGDQKKIEKLQAAYKLLEQKSKASKEITKGQILPLAAELMKEFKALEYGKLQITSYQAPIGLNFYGARIRLQVSDENGKSYDVFTDTNEGAKLTVVWK